MKMKQRENEAETDSSRITLHFLYLSNDAELSRTINDVKPGKQICFHRAFHFHSFAVRKRGSD